MKAYLWEFVKEGNPRAIELGAVMDLKKLDYSQVKKSAEQADKIDLKWANEGIKYNNYVSYKRLGDRQMDKYRKTRHVQDSLKAEELYQKSIDAGNMHLRMERDAKSGLKAVVMGGIEYGKFSHENIFNERSAIARLVLSGAYTFAYVVSGSLKLLFTSAWWKVLLLLLGMLLLLLFLIVLAVNVLSRGPNTEKDESVARFGVFFGFWNSMCFFTAISRNNIVWLNNTTSLLFPPSAYGLQQYLSILMNWIALIYIVVVIIKAIKDGREDLLDVGEILRSILAKVAIFIFTYLIAQVGGYLMLIVLIAMLAMSFAVGVVVSAPSALTEAADDSDESPSGKQWDENYKICDNCWYWNDGSHDCPFHAGKKNWNETCQYWRNSPTD